MGSEVGPNLGALGVLHGNSATQLGPDAVDGYRMSAAQMRCLDLTEFGVMLHRLSFAQYLAPSMPAVDGSQRGRSA